MGDSRVTACKFLLLWDDLGVKRAINREQVLKEAWIGDAVLTLYARLKILREDGETDGPKAARMTSNQFLAGIGEPSEVEARIGRVYADSTQQYLARYISDPTGWGTDGTTSVRTSRRGNPGLPDNFSYFALELSYKFRRSPGRRNYMSF